jgi:glutamyl-tRNA reductase
VIVVVGLSHREAPLDVRERLAIDGEGIAELLRALLQRPAIREALCVSTCNRIEVYAVGQQDSDEHTLAAAEAVRHALIELAGNQGAAQGVGPYLRTHVRRDAVLHLFRVASSLDSLVVGEPQILGQVRDALEMAKAAGSIGKYLDRATNRALHVAKRVRSETAIGEGQVSVASVAVDLARQIFGELTGRTALLIGAGEMAEGAAKLLVKAGAKLLVVNRSLERARQLALEFGGGARPWEELAAALVQADVVIASTSAKVFVVTRAMVAKAMKARRGRSLFFIDIAVPRDVDPAVNDIDNVYLYDIDNLSNLVAESMQGRRAEAERAEALVQHEVRVFETWTETLGVTATIVALRAKVRAALAAEVDRTLTGRLKHLTDADRKALETMIDAAVNKLLHTPTSRIKALAADPRGDDLVKAVHHLFDLADAVRDIDAAQKPDSPANEGENPADPEEPARRGQGSTPVAAGSEGVTLALPGGRETLGR